MLYRLLATSASAALLAGCATYDGSGIDSTETTATIDGDTGVTAVNIPEGTGYFASDSDLPFLAPDFTKISEDDYIPAFEQGMAIQKAEVQAIIDNPAAPTFDNTIVALEKSGRMLGRVGRVFFRRRTGFAASRINSRSFARQSSAFRLCSRCR